MQILIIFNAKSANFCNFSPKKCNFCQIFPKKVYILTIFPQKSANLDTFPLLKVKNRGKLFHNFFAQWGKNKIFWQNIHLCFQPFQQLVWQKFAIQAAFTPPKNPKMSKKPIAPYPKSFLGVITFLCQYVTFQSILNHFSNKDCKNALFGLHYAPPQGLKNVKNSSRPLSQKISWVYYYFQANI